MGRIIRGLSLAAVVVGGAILGGCSISPVVKDAVVTPNLRGTVVEQIAYHKSEVQKYKAEVDKQEARARQALSERRMGDYRASMNLRKQYSMKMEMHVKKMSLLQETP